LRITIYLIIILASSTTFGQKVSIVLHISSTTNVPIAQWQSPIDDINNLLAGVNSCDSEFISSSTINLCFAQQDAFENNSNGINILSDVFSEFNSCQDELALKSLPRMMGDPYPTLNYLNFYLVDEICAPCETFGCAAGGYARLPHEHGTTMDGIILEVDTWLGDCNDMKIILHELGHYFGLYHTFEGGCKNDNCQEDGDKICDTSPQFLPIVSNNHICLSDSMGNSCFTDVNINDPNNPFNIDQFDPDDNIMNYVPVSCQKRFTPGQISKMEATLLAERKTLLSTNGCLPPCASPIVFDFEIPENVYVGIPEIISNNTSNAISFEWYIQDQSFISTNLNLNFTQEGNYQIKIYASNGIPECDRDTIFNVLVNCLEGISISLEETK
ncbi:MAG: hypothetical protein ACI86M_002500, partial [Saprospiraceae bacterium]